MTPIRRLRLLSLLPLLLVSLLSPEDALSQARIIGGTKASPDTYPWMGALATKGATSLYYRQFCGASLISPDWVITAAHCVEGKIPSQLQVAVGLTNLDDPSSAELRSVRGIFIHPQYTDRDGDELNDIALLLLSSPIDTIQPILMATVPNPVPLGTSLRALGWGNTKSALGYPQELRMVDLNLVSIAVARRAYRSNLLDARHLAAMASGRDTCDGDSGGPLFKSGVDGGSDLLVGLTSYGLECAQRNIPGIYTNVGNYSTWTQVFLNSPTIGQPAISVLGRGYLIPNRSRALSAIRGTDFGPALTGKQTRVRAFSVRNPGATALSISSVTCSNPAFSLAGSMRYVLPGRSSVFRIRYRVPKASQNRRVRLSNSRLTIRNNSPNDPSYGFSLRARYRSSGGR